MFDNKNWVEYTHFGISVTKINSIYEKNRICYSIVNPSNT